MASEEQKQWMNWRNKKGKEHGSEYAWKCNSRKMEKHLRGREAKGWGKDPCVRERRKCCEGKHTKRNKSWHKEVLLRIKYTSYK